MDLRIDRDAVERCRKLAAAITDPIEEFIASHSTVSVERAVLRLLGVDGITPQEVPLPNAVVDLLSADDLEHGVALPFGKAIAETGLEPSALAQSAERESSHAAQFAKTPAAAARGALRPYVEAALARIGAAREERSARLARLPQQSPPLALRYRRER